MILHRGVPVTAALRQKPTEACIRRLCQLTLCPIPFRGIPAYPRSNSITAVAAPPSRGLRNLVHYFGHAARGCDDSTTVWPPIVSHQLALRAA